MRIRKSVAALAFCASGATVALLGAGTALAAHDVAYGPFANQDQCGQALLDHSKDPGFIGGQCDPRADGEYAVITYK